MPKLSEIYLEIRGDLSKQPQFKEEAPLVEATGEENPGIEDVPADLLVDEAEI